MFFIFFQLLCSFLRCRLIQTWIGQRTDLWFVGRSGKTMNISLTLQNIPLLIHPKSFLDLYLESWIENNTSQRFGYIVLLTWTRALGVDLRFTVCCGDNSCSRLTIQFHFETWILSLIVAVSKSIPLTQMISNTSIWGHGRKLCLKPYFFT